jgi:glutamine amidotransferase
MGWNNVEIGKADPLVAGLLSPPRFYFVHSYHLVCDEPGDVLFWATYGTRFAAGVRRGNICGTQFHPEKSHGFGLALIRNFVSAA